MENDNVDSSGDTPEGNGQSSWLDSVDDSYRNDPAIAGHESINDLIKEHINAQSLLGRKGVIIPKEGDADSTFNQFRQALGIPESPEKYSLEGFSAPENWDSEFQNQFAKIAHQNGVSDKAFSEILSTYAQWASGVSEQVANRARELTEERRSALRTEFGAAYEAKTGLGSAALNQITDGKPESLAHLTLNDGTALGDHPDFVKAMAKIGKTMSESGLVGDKNVNTSTLTPEEAAKELALLEGDPEKFKIIFYEKDNPAHQELVKQRDRLLSLMYPEE